MTNEEIEAVRGSILAGLRAYPQSELRRRADLLDTLCEAVRQPESLVGRRVIVPGGSEAIISGIGFKLDWLHHDLTGYYDRDDFELLEDADVDK
jgi:hypothetical protein